jgi:hypothetical protein
LFFFLGFECRHEAEIDVIVSKLELLLEVIGLIYATGFKIDLHFLVKVDEMAELAQFCLLLDFEAVSRAARV